MADLGEMLRALEGKIEYKIKTGQITLLEKYIRSRH